MLNDLSGALLISKFKALLIDLDDTLLPEWDIAYPIWDEVCDEAAAAIGLDPAALSQTLKTTSQQLLDRSSFGDMARKTHYDGMALMWDTLDFNGPPVENLDFWIPEFRSLVWAEAVASLGHDGTPNASDFAHRMSELGLIRRVPYADAFPTLNYLAEKYRLVAVTNGVPGVQARKVERHGFSDLFDHVVLCDQYHQKPDPLPFSIAMELAGVRHDECAMIGNSLSRDINGAHGVGMFSVWVNRNGEKHQNQPEPDLEINSLDQLRDVF